MRQMPIQNLPVSVYTFEIPETPLASSSVPASLDRRTDELREDAPTLRLYKTNLPLLSEGVTGMMEFWNYVQNHARVASPPMLQLRRGQVERLPFPPVRDGRSLVIVNVGAEWILWVGREVGADEESAARSSLTRGLERQTKDGNRNPDKSVFAMLGFTTSLSAEAIKLRVVRQGFERTLFRQHFKIFADFEPAGEVSDQAYHLNFKGAFSSPREVSARLSIERRGLSFKQALAESVGLSVEANGQIKPWLSKKIFVNRVQRGEKNYRPSNHI
jgi:hypothetical protein